MIPSQFVKVNELHQVRESVRKYFADNVGWRAEDRDLVWSQRFVVARLALLHGQEMMFGDLETQVASALAETPAPSVRGLTPELIAEKICERVESLFPDLDKPQIDTGTGPDVV
jgi:hypothetical protein